jgi:hypothetical protein
LVLDLCDQGKRIAHVMLWTFVFGFCVILAFLASYLELDKENAISKDCPPAITDPKTDTILVPAPDPYDCIP